MPIVDKWDKNNRYNYIPVERDPAKKWEGFSADKLKGNEIRCGDAILAKIPQLKGLISRKKRTDEYGHTTTYIELVTERWYDPEKKQTRNKRVCIGIDIDHIYRGMMIINEKYHQYFHASGELIQEPKNEKKEKPGKSLRDAQEGNKEKHNGDSIRDSSASAGKTESTDGKTVKERIKENQSIIHHTETEEEYMDKDDQKIQEELDRKEHLKDQFQFLNNLLCNYKGVVDNQLPKGADKPMSRYQIRRINELLQDIREFMKVFEFTEYLQLAEEPDAEGGGMTYGDMAVLLEGYRCLMSSYYLGRLWYRNDL